MTTSQINYRLRFEILRRDGYRCRYCGRGAPYVVLHVDHVIARSRGGGDEPSNLVTACRPCNLGKGAMDGRDTQQLSRDILELAPDLLDDTAEFYASWPYDRGLDPIARLTRYLECGYGDDTAFWGLQVLPIHLHGHRPPTMVS